TSAPSSCCWTTSTSNAPTRPCGGGARGRRCWSRPAGWRWPTPAPTPRRGWTTCRSARSPTRCGRSTWAWTSSPAEAPGGSGSDRQHDLARDLARLLPPLRLRRLGERQGDGDVDLQPALVDPAGQPGQVLAVRPHEQVLPAQFEHTRIDD